MTMVEEFLPRRELGLGPKLVAEVAEALGDIASQVLAEIYRAWQRPRAALIVRDMQRRLCLCAHDYLVGHRSPNDQEAERDALSAGRTNAWEDLSNALSGISYLEVPRTGGAVIGLEVLAACTVMSITRENEEEESNEESPAPRHASASS